MLSIMIPYSWAEPFITMIYHLLYISSLVYIYIYLNDILSRNKTKLPTKLRDNINAIDITNKLDIANTLNNFFTSIGRNLAQNINYTGYKNHRYYLKTNHKKVFKFKEIEQESITMVINSLTNKSSVGINGISTIFRASKLKDHKIGRSPYFEETKSGDFFTGTFQGASVM